MAEEGCFFGSMLRKTTRQARTSKGRGAHYNIEEEEERNEAKEEEQEMIQR